MFARRVLLRLARVCALVVLTFSSGLGAAPSSPAGKMPHADRSVRLVFWFGMDNNEMLTPAMVDWIGERASLVILRSAIKGADPYFDYGECVARFKKRCPGLPVLVYQQAMQAVSYKRVDSLGWEVLRSHPEWLLHGPDGSILQLGKSRAVYQDITNTEWREHMADHCAEVAGRFGADGVALDVYWGGFPLRYMPAEQKLQDGKRIREQWEASSLDLMSRIKGALGPDRMVVFNGLLNHHPDRWKEPFVESMRKVLALCDGGLMEFFAMTRQPGYVDPLAGEFPAARDRTDFEKFVLEPLETADLFPDKALLFTARGGRGRYHTFEEDYRVQRYGFASYLLGATPTSLFRYLPSFQTQYIPPGRARGNDYYADWDLDLGKPVGARFEEGGIWQRRFSKGRVAVAPPHAGARTLTLDKTYFSPEGEELSGRIEIEEGRGVVLLDSKPDWPSRVVINDFEDGNPGFWQFPVKDEETGVVEEGGNRYLKARVAPDAVQPYHETRVQPVRSLRPRLKFSCRIRTEDPASALLLRVEVDDRSQTPEPREGEKADARKTSRAAFAVLVVRPEAGTRSFKAKGKDIPYGELRSRCHAPYFEAPAGDWKADGRWSGVRLNLTESLPAIAPHLQPWRISEMRLLGNADLDDIVVER